MFRKNLKPKDMNLYEVSELIKSLDPEKDAELIAFYNKKRNELIKQINEDLKKKGII